MTNNINWAKIWDDFDLWMDNPDNEHLCNPSWEEQQAKIQELADDQVRKVVKLKI